MEKFQEGVSLMDEYIEVDRAMIDIYGQEQITYQLNLKTIAMAQNATRVFLKGDASADPREVDGLQRRATNTGVTLFHNSTASGGAPLSLSKLDQVIAEVNRPTHIMIPRKMQYLWDGAARSPTLTNGLVTYADGNGSTDLGRTGSLRYKGIPILHGYDPDDSPEVLDFTEVGNGGGAAVTASIYVLSIGEDRFHMIEETPLTVKDEGQMQGKPFHTWHVKWDWGLTSRHPRSFARLTSSTNAAIVA
jgi:hypothetical protein